MTDIEMVAEARYQARDVDDASVRDCLFKLASRVEELTQPHPNTPVAESRLEELRTSKYISEYASDAVKHAMLAHDFERRRADRIEGVLSEFCIDHDHLIQTGVAKALAIVQDIWSMSGREMREAYGTDNVWKAVHVACRTAELPSHEQTIEERRQYKKALEEITECLYNNVHDATKCRQIARKALGMDPIPIEAYE